MDEKGTLGYTCQCGHWNPCASVWAAAHWHEVLRHMCVGCKVHMIVKNGNCLGPDGDYA